MNSLPGLTILLFLTSGVAPTDLVPPVAGLPCGGSMHVLGETWPPSTSATPEQDIVDIKALVSNDEPDRPVVGWIYRLRNTDMFVEGRFGSHEWQSIDRDLQGQANAGTVFPVNAPFAEKLTATLKARSVRVLPCFKGTLES